MPRKVFNVTVEFDLHAVTCPGVWLCPKGKVSLRISMLDSLAETSDIEPVFPLLIHETFTFSHTFHRVRYLQDLAYLFGSQLLTIQLIQWGPSLSDGNILSTFETSLEELLYPSPPSRALLAGVDVDLLMEPTDIFPGIIAPKVEVSTRTTIEEALTSSLCDVRSSVFPKTLLSKTAGAQNKRQRKVCHTRATKVPGRLRAQSCRVQRNHAGRSQPTAWPRYNDGYESSLPASLSSLQHLIWKATSRDINGPLAETDVGSPPRQCSSANSLKNKTLEGETNVERPAQRCASANCLKNKTVEGETDVGRPARQCGCKTCHKNKTRRGVTGSEKLSPKLGCLNCSLEGEIASPRNESTVNQPTLGLGGMSRPNRTFKYNALRNVSPTSNKTLLAERTFTLSSFERRPKRVKSPESRASRKASPSRCCETRHDVTPRSKSGPLRSVRYRPSGCKPTSFPSSLTPSRKHSPCETRRISCVACANEEPDRFLLSQGATASHRQKQDERRCGGQGDACACAGRQSPSVRRHQDPSTAVRTALRGSADTSYRESFYRSLEKFYKRLYDQAHERRNRTSCDC